MRTIKSSLLISAVALLGLSSLSFAEVPPDRMNYQGVLRDSLGNPVNATLDMQFVFWDSDGGPTCNGGVHLLGDQHFAVGTGAVTVTGGLFNVELGGGAITPGLASSLSELFNSTAVYMEVFIGSPPNPEKLCPRIRLLSTAYALNSSTLEGKTASQFIDTSSNQSMSGDLIVTGSSTIALQTGSDLRASGAGSNLVMDSGSSLVFDTGSCTTCGTNSGNAIELLNGSDLRASGAGSNLVMDSGSSLVFDPGPCTTCGVITGNAITLQNGSDIRTSGVGSNLVMDSGSSLVFDTGSCTTCGTNSGNAIELLNGSDLRASGAGSNLVMDSGSSLVFDPGPCTTCGVITGNAITLQNGSDMAVTGAGSQIMLESGGQISSTETGNTIVIGDGRIQSTGTGSDVTMEGGLITATGLGSGIRLENGSDLVISAGGGVTLDGTLGGSIDFTATESLTWDAPQTRFEMSDALAIEGPLRVGDIVNNFNYNSLTDVPSIPTPASGQMGSPGDLYVKWDLEVGNDLALSDNSTNEHIGTIKGFSGSPPRLELRTIDLGVYTPDFPSILPDPDVSVASTGRVLLSADEDSDSGWFSFPFLWSFRLNTLMSLDNFGSLRIDGSYLPGPADIAEAFFMGEPLEAGELVRISADNPRKVLRSLGEGDDTMIGVVSTRPGIVLAGSALTINRLREMWDEEVVDAFERNREEFERAALPATTGVDARKHTLDSVGPVLEENGEGQNEHRAARYVNDMKLRRGELEAEMLRLFFERDFVPVALSGRVPVKVDTSFGEIEPGDYLTPSPIPGVAMKSTRTGPTIGTALESFNAGRGTVMAFIHRGHYTPAEGIANIEETQTTLAADLERRTPDPVTGIQGLPGNLQVVLDKDANERARFSVFRDGKNGLDEELMRLDEEGNLHLMGALRPASMDLAEYHLVHESVEVGDVLVMDRTVSGLMRRGEMAADVAVVGIVSGEPGVLLGAGIRRLAAENRDLAEKLDQARTLGDREEEARIWSELEHKFKQSHAPVALAGTVDCKVDAGYGTIRPGDLLTTSLTPGHAMRSNDPRPGTILGKALEPLDAGTGVIKVLVMLR